MKAPGGVATFVMLLFACMASGAHAQPTVSNRGSVPTAVGATKIGISGSGFASGDTSVTLSADGGTVTQPTEVTVVSSTELVVTVSPLSDDLLYATMYASVTTSAGGPTSPVAVAFVFDGPFVKLRHAAAIRAFWSAPCLIVCLFFFFHISNRL